MFSLGLLFILILLFSQIQGHGDIFHPGLDVDLQGIQPLILDHLVFVFNVPTYKQNYLLN